MKKINLILIALVSLGFLVSCDNNDDKFTGSPVGVMPLETVTATVSTNAMFALPGQEIDFTATLPESFRAVVTDTVTVQATLLSMGGGVRNASVDILPGQNSGTEKITVPGGGGTFDLSVDLKLTAINLKKVIPGKHFLLTSNVVNIASGNSGVPTTNDKRLKLIVDWESKTTGNRIKVKIERVKLTTVTLRGSSGSANIKIGTNIYPTPFTTDLSITASTFVANNAASILANNNIEVTAVGSDLQFRYTTDAIPAITISTVPPNNSTALKGDVYSEVAVGQPGDTSKTYFFSASKLGTTSEGVFNPTQSSSYAYTPGDYRIKLGITGANDLETPNPTDLKYRLVLKFPDGSVKIYNGVYQNISIASGFKTVLTITKIGLGDSATYGDPVFTP